MKAGLAALLTACLLAPPVMAEEAAPPSPSGAWRWSLVFPGIGQMALGEPLRGTAFTMSTLLLPVLGYTGVHIALTPDQPSAAMGSQFLDDQTLMMTGIGVAVALAAGLWTWSAFDAYHLDLDKHRPLPQPEPSPEPVASPSPEAAAPLPVASPAAP